MTFQWPGFLYALLLIPALIAAYIWVLRRRRRFAVHYSSLSLVPSALLRGSQWRRHVPFGLFVVALASLLVALSRPISIVTVPGAQANITPAAGDSASLQTQIRNLGLVTIAGPVLGSGTFHNDGTIQILDGAQISPAITNDWIVSVIASAPSREGR